MFTKTGGNITKTSSKPPFIYCLNMATIRGHKLGFVKQLEVASAAGFRSVEIWIDSLKEHLKNGGTTRDVRKRLGDLGLTVEDSIGFGKWIVDDESTRRQALEQINIEMGLLAQIGCKRMAAPAMGATDVSPGNLDIVAERYRTILDLGAKSGVVPQLEMWGFLKILSNVSDVLYVAMQSGHPSARILLDIFHLYWGNTSLDTLPLMNPMAVDILHMNDYPAGIPWQTITDADRIYPGDGMAPIKRILKILLRHDRSLVLSTELFNKEYYKLDAFTVAKTALAKMRSATENI
ncbi:MAG: sugar phosphate isomerase/epimerase [Bacteroidota bacterium]|nr:sugar phosphate isomerase/epimerase [Bacteroidota bacterium]